MKTVKEVEDAILTRLYCFYELWTIFSILKSRSLSGFVKYVKIRLIGELFVLSGYVNMDGLWTDKYMLIKFVNALMHHAQQQMFLQKLQ